MKKHREEPSGDEWLSTYADMVTLLMTFFVLMFASSTPEEEKWQILVEAFAKESSKPSQVVTIPEGEGENLAGNATGQTPNEGVAAPGDQSLPEDFVDLYSYIKEYVEENQLEGSIEVKQEGENVYLRLTDNLFFDPNRSELKPQAIPILDHIGIAVKHMENAIKLIHINGHTASVDNYSASVDRNLSSDRSNNVLVYLEDQKGFPPTKLSSIGWGRNYPIASNDHPQEKMKNRRVDILIIGNNSDKVTLEQLQQITGTDFSGNIVPNS